MRHASLPAAATAAAAVCIINVTIVLAGTVCPQRLSCALMVMSRTLPQQLTGVAAATSLEQCLQQCGNGVCVLALLLGRLMSIIALLLFPALTVPCFARRVCCCRCLFAQVRDVSNDSVPEVERNGFVFQ
jgi:hypothetical protein